MTSGQFLHLFEMLVKNDTNNIKPPYFMRQTELGKNI